MRLDLDVKQIRDQITALLIAHPDLADDDDLRLDMVEGATTTFEFLSKLVRLIGENDALAIGLTSYIRELNIRMERLELRDEVLRSFIFKIMSSADLPKVQLPEATLFIQPGRPSVIITDENLISDQYFRIKREPNKTLIKAAIDSGTVVPGTEISNSPPVLAIKVK